MKALGTDFGTTSFYLVPASVVHGPASSFSITEELIRNADPQVPSQTY